MADPHLVSYLAERNEPCPACSYNLRGLLTDHCPECNRHLVLQVRLAEPRLGAWITALVGACMMLGFNGLLLLFFLTMIMRRGGGTTDWEWTRLVLISTIISGAMLAFLLLKRRWICNLPTGGRTGIAVTVWALTAVSTSIFFSFAR